MKKYNLHIITRIAALIIISAGTGFLSGQNYYWAIPAGILLIYWIVYDLIRFQKRTARDTKRLIDAIRFSEFNISFNNFTSKGLAMELAPEMEKAIARFNEKLQHIETEQRFYDTLLNRIDAAILVINKAGEIEWINKAAIDEFGKPQPRRLTDLAAISSGLPEILGKLLPREAKIIKIKKGEHIHQLAATAVLFNSKGKDLKLVSLKNIQSVLEESESDAWKKLIRVLTHEMMNSITPIISLAETFSEQADTETHNYELMNRAMLTIHRRSRGLLEFVGNYQKLTRIPPPAIAIFSAREMMNDITYLLNADGIRFSCNIQPEDMTLSADRTQIEQVLINLVKNAWEACTNNPSPRIEILFSKNEFQKPVIMISDNGHGILPEVLDKIFVPFFTTKAGGSGIGLSICRQIMISHNGSITIESEPEKGTQVTLVF